MLSASIDSVHSRAYVGGECSFVLEILLC